MMKRTWMSSFPLPDTRGLGLIWFLVFYFTCSFVLSKFCSECELIDVSSTVFVLATYLSETVMAPQSPRKLRRNTQN